MNMKYRVYTLFVSVLISVRCISCDTIFLDNCPRIEPCILFHEGDCDYLGRRQICITRVPLPGCPLTNAATVAGACVEHTDYATLTQPWFVNTPLCKVEVPGGNSVSFGIRDGTTLSGGTRPRSLRILGSKTPVTCSDHTNVCSFAGNSDIKLTFKVSTCSSDTKTTTAIAPTTTTTVVTVDAPIPPSQTTASSTQKVDCLCSDYVNVGICSTTCGRGFQHQEKYCVGSGCNGKPKDIKLTECQVKECPSVGRRSSRTQQTEAPIDSSLGIWSQFSEFSECSVTCGNGFKQRVRRCVSPEESRVEPTCPGADTEITPCNLQSCSEEFIVLRAAQSPTRRANHSPPRRRHQSSQFRRTSGGRRRSSQGRRPFQNSRTNGRQTPIGRRKSRTGNVPKTRSRQQIGPRRPMKTPINNRSNKRPARKS